jgi:hypothetical protein
VLVRYSNNFKKLTGGIKAELEQVARYIDLGKNFIVTAILLDLEKDLKV